MTEPHLTDDELIAFVGAPSGEDRHLQECPSCLERLQDMERLLARIDAHPAAPSPGVWNDVRTAIGQGRRRRTGLAAGLAVALAAAVFLLAVVAPAAGGVTFPLVGTAFAPGASATVHWTADGSGELTVSHLPNPGAGRVYELWAVAGGIHHREAVFRPDALGESTVALTVPPAFRQASFGVTLEPAPGSAEPTGPRVLRPAAP